MALQQESTNLLGQKIGRKGRETRKRIMNVLLEMLADSSYKDITVSELANECGISSSTFYVYFEDIEDVLFACVQETTPDLRVVIDVLDQDWNLTSLEEKVAELVDTYSSLWERHRIELRIRNLEAYQGNLRFMNYLVESTRAIQIALGEKISRVNPEIQSPQSVATVIFAAMDIIAASHEMGLGGATRQTRKKLNAGIVTLVSRALKSRQSETDATPDLVIENP